MPCSIYLLYLAIFVRFHACGLDSGVDTPFFLVCSVSALGTEHPEVNDWYRHFDKQSAHGKTASAFHDLNV